jgi:hypothetical protein
MKILQWIRLNKWIVIISLFLVVLSGFSLRSCIALKKADALNVANLAASRDSIRHYSITIDGLKNSVHEKAAIILSQQQAIDAGIIERELLKKLHIKDLITNTELTGVIHQKDSLLNLPPKVEFITVKDSSGVTKNYIRYPFQLLRIHNTYLNLDAGLDSLKKAWFDLSNPLSGSISIGYKRKGFLKPLKPVGVFVSKNPYITINSMDILIIREPKKWYEKTWVHVGAGAVIFESVRYLLTGKL